MRNQKGFIATTLIYSFFLVFIAVILAFIVTAVHNKNLIAKANDNIRKDLATKKLGNRDMGTYVDYKLNIDDLYTGDVKWVVFNSDSNRTELVSTSIVFSHNNLDFVKQVINSISDDCYVSNVRLLTYDDIYLYTEHNVNNIKQLQAILNVDTKGSSDANSRANYLIMQNGTPKRYTYKEPTNEAELESLDAFKEKAFSPANLTSYSSGDRMNIRVIITLSAGTKIIAGEGTYANPYRISTEKCYSESYLINKILQKGYDNGDNYTIPGVEAATNDEGLRTAPDDYGVSYYFRGMVENNYVVFANMCWRIVRIDGLGNIKLVLQKNDGIDCSEDAFDKPLLKEGSTINFAYNDGVDSNAYLDFMYGDTTGTTYDTVHAMTHDSVALTKLKNWYNSKIPASERTKLADVIWCNDLGLDSGTGVGNTTTTIYKPRARIYPSDTANPTFKCNNVTNYNIGRYSSTTTNGGNGLLGAYKIGMITSDEAAYAGSIYSTDVSLLIGTYLTRGMQRGSWTLSPAQFSKDTVRASMIFVTADGRLSFGRTDSTSYGIRPMVALKPDVLASGNGTVRNPYVVQ